MYHVPSLLNVYMEAVMKEVKMGIGKRVDIGNYLDSCMQMNFFLCGESEENLRVMVRWFVDV